MLIDSGNFTERQRNIISTIGKEKREFIDRDRNRFVLVQICIMLSVAVIFFFLVIIGYVEFTYDVVLVIVAFVTLGSIISHKQKQLNELKGQSDYKIGLYYGSSYRKVIGNANKKLKSIRISSFIIAPLFLIMVLVIFLININDEPTDFRELREAQGVLEEALYYKNDRLEIELKYDNVKYRVSSLYFDEINIDEFYEFAEQGMSVVLLYKNSNNDKIRNVYFIEIDGKVFLSEEEVIQAEKENTLIGWIVCAVFAFFTLFTTIYYFVYKRTIYRKNKAQEIYNLDFTDDEIKELQVEIAENDEITDVYIKTSYPKWALNILIVFSIIGWGIFIGAFFIKDPLGMWVCIGMGLFFGLVSAVALFDLTRNNEVLDKDNFTVIRFFKKKTIKAKDLKSISEKGQYIIFSDRNGKTFCRVSSMTKNIDKIVEALGKRGVKIERILI